MISVSIIMGSDSDMPVMSQAAGVLEELQIEYEMRILSAHRQTKELIDYLEKANSRCRQSCGASRDLRLRLPPSCDRGSDEDIRPWRP